MTKIILKELGDERMSFVVQKGNVYKFYHTYDEEGEHLVSMREVLDDMAARTAGE